MKITDSGPLGSANNANKTRRSSGAGGGFADILAAAEAGDATPSAPTSDAAATTALSNLLLLQEISEEDIQRKKLMQQGKNMLDVLENLRRQLLLGTLPPNLLHDLHRQLALHKQAVNDPYLTSIIEDIELRAAVELAKLKKAIDSADLGTPLPG